VQVCEKAEALVETLSYVAEIDSDDSEIRGTLLQEQTLVDAWVQAPAAAMAAEAALP
jgi:hypothetical protein